MDDQSEPVIWLRVLTQMSPSLPKCSRSPSADKDRRVLAAAVFTFGPRDVLNPRWLRKNVTDTKKPGGLGPPGA